MFGTMQLVPLVTVFFSLAASSSAASLAPSRVQCPAGIQVRRATESVPINPLEQEYVSQKTKKSAQDWTTYLKNANMSHFDIKSFTKGIEENGVPGVTMPNIAVALSGGGERAALFGAAVLAAFDVNNEASSLVEFRGLTQVLTYVSGLSGGSWTVGSWAMHNFVSLETIRDQFWNLKQDLFFPGILSTAVMLWEMYATYSVKTAAGFAVSVVDILAVALGRHLHVDPDGKQGLFSSIRQMARFKEHSAPFPIILAVARADGAVELPVDSPIYEFTPYEFGTSSESVEGGAYIPIEHLGTKMSAGSPVENCVVGFDATDFILATSSDVVGAPVEGLLQVLIGTSYIKRWFFGAMFKNMKGSEKLDAEIPNPFQKLENASDFQSLHSSSLHLVDGGYVQENIPFEPLLHPGRHVDVIIAVDASSDGGPYPNGQAPRATYTKSLLPGYKGNSVPYFPTTAQYISDGLGSRPHVFGCYAKEPSTPLVVLIPNSAFSTNRTATSVLKWSYPVEVQHAFFEDGQAIASQNQNAEWGTCLACVVVDAEVKRQGLNRTEQCHGCFEQHCYKRTSDSD